MNLLSLDIGFKRTGVAFANTESNVPVSLDTLTHCDLSDLAKMVLSLVEKKSIDHLVIGLPLLPNGNEGRQTEIVRNFASQHLGPFVTYSFIDERYTSPRSTNVDGDSEAALAILTTYLDLHNT